MSCTERNHAAVLPTIVATAVTLGFLWFCIQTAADRSADERDARACATIVATVGLSEDYCAPAFTDSSGTAHPASFPLVTECARVNHNDMTRTRACIEAGGGDLAGRLAPDPPAGPGDRPLYVNG